MGFLLMLLSQACSQNRINLSCCEYNDLYIVLKANQINYKRFDTPGEAIKKGP
jgi:hypothetical protein